MDIRRRSVPHALVKGSPGVSPNTEDVQRQQTFAFGSYKGYQRNQSRDNLRFVKLWHDRTLTRKTFGQEEFQAKATFKKAIKRTIYLLRATNAFQSCLGESSSVRKHDPLQYFVNILDLKENGEEEEGTANEASSAKPLFDPTWFKANREIRLGSETKAILSQTPSSRTPEQVQTVFRYLHTLPSFAEYPLYYQNAICHDASYQSFGANVTILKQGHRADNFYFVLSGSATVISNSASLDAKNNDDDNSESVSVVKKGMAFGETAIMTNSLRKVTVVSKTPIELLVVSKEDYTKIFFGRDSESGKKEYIRFLKTIDFLREWPVDILKSNAEQSQHCYFRRGAVIVRNSNNSPWLYVIKSGVCEVLIKLNAVKPRKAIGRKPRQFSYLEELTQLTMEQRREFKQAKDRQAYPADTKPFNVDTPDYLEPQRHRRKSLCYVPKLGLVNSTNAAGRKYSKEDSLCSKINSIAEEDFASEFSNDVLQTTQSSSTSCSSSTIRRMSCHLPTLNQTNTFQTFLRRKRRNMPFLHNEDLSLLPRRTRSFSLPSSISTGELSRLSKTKPAFVRIDLLHPKRVFGLSELDFEYNALHPGRPASVSLVSRGAECIMISKKFFMEHANALTKRWIRLNVQPYLPTEKHQETLQEKVDWETFKKKIVNSVVR